ncbi:hypothetical protein OTB74_16750 [Streptomyces sp. H34-S4]|nr:hypothetical protein [Streptomyces sp. H34-S4]
MCWSATADLTGGTAITAAGISCLARTRRARDLPLAALPLILGAHQLIEVAVWHSGAGCGPASTVWAAIALPLLPVRVSLGVLLAAAPELRTRLYWPAAAGLATGAYLSYRLATRPVTAEIRGHVLGYGVNVPWMPLALAGYLFATIGALLISEDRLLRLLGPPHERRGPGLRCSLEARVRFRLVRLRGGRIDADPGLDRRPCAFPLCTRGRRPGCAEPVTPARVANRSTCRR